MAKEKLELEIEPTISQSGIRKLQQQFSTAANAAVSTGKEATKGLGGLAVEKGEAFAGRLGLGEAAGKAKSVFKGGMSGELGGLAVAAGAVGVAVAAATGALDKFLDSMNYVASFVGVSSPAAIKRMNDAWDDMYAVIGNRLEPYLNAFTDGLRIMADFLQTILPSQKEVNEVMKEYQPMLRDIRELLGDIAPLIRDELTKVLQGGIIVVRKFSSAVKELIEVLRNIPGAEKYLGKAGVHTPLQSSIGMAARGGSIVSGDQLAQSAIIAAMSAGMSPAERTARSTEETARLMAELVEQRKKEGRDLETGEMLPRRFN